MNANAQYAQVKLAEENRWVLCEVKEEISCSYSLLPQVAVKAVHGRPFDGHNIAIVSSSRVSYVKGEIGKVQR